MDFLPEEFRAGSWLPFGRNGTWEIREDPLMPGYLQLVEWDDSPEGRLWMDDRPRELESHLHILNAATGRVVVAGMGLMAVQVALARKPEVELVHTIELNQPVVDLVWPHVRNLPSAISAKLTYEIGDAVTYKPALMSPFDFGYFDHTLTPMNAEQQSLIREHYAAVCHQHLFWAYPQPGVS